ncbi:hypothetical protein QR77_02950 [Streptomyces sp. 150FB]|nr:hypothetical protein QR77_02950 [Streptomyces sp. 150FB]
MEPGQGPDSRRDEIPLLECRSGQAAVRRVLAELAEGRAGFLTAIGQPGHAQNALSRWAARLAGDAGVRVLHARAAPTEHALPYGVIVQLMTALGGHWGDPLPDLIERGATGDLPGLDELLRSAATVPTALVVEDTQWLDTASQNWLRSLIRRLPPDVPLAVMVSGSGMPAASHSRLCTAPDSPVLTEHLVLGALSERGVAAAVERFCATPGDSRFIAEAAAATAGNPSVLFDVLSRFTDEGHAPVATRLPELHALTAAVTGDHATRTLNGLPPYVTSLLRALAVCSDVLSFQLVRRLAGWEPTPEPELRALLEASGLAVRAGTRMRVRFPGVKARVLEDMPAGERADLYGRAAELAHLSAAGDKETVDLLLVSEPLGAPWVVPLLRRGFAAALDRDDHSRASACLTRALRETREPDERARLALELAAAEAVASPEAGDRGLGELVRAGGHVPAELRVRAVDLGLARGNSDWARGAASEALSLVPPADRDGLLALYWLAVRSGDDTELTVPEVPALPDSPELPAQAGVRAWELASQGRQLERTRLLARAALAGGAPDTALLLPRLAACRALILTDDHEEAAAGLATLLTDSRRDRLRAVTARVLAVRAELHLRAGRLDAAERDVAAAEQALPLASWHPFAASELIALRILTALECGDLDRAKALAAEPAPPGAEKSVSWSSLLFARARVAQSEGRWSDVLELTRESGRRLLCGQWSNPLLLGWRGLAAEANRALGDRAEAVRLSAEELRLARGWGSAGAVAVAGVLAERLAGEDDGAVLAGDDNGTVPHTGRPTYALRDIPARPAYPRAPSQRARSARLVVHRHERRGGSPAPSPPREWAALSEAERHTATFAGRGHANREIAELLSVSVRTVELRLSKTYRKLRLAGRDELRSLVRTLEGRAKDAP